MLAGFLLLPSHVHLWAIPKDEYRISKRLKHCMPRLQVCDYPSFEAKTRLAGHMERVVTCKFDPSGRQDKAFHIAALWSAVALSFLCTDWCQMPLFFLICGFLSFSQVELFV